MSYIDTFDHELVAFFAGLPLYHPLEVVSGVRADEFACAPSELVLGGGGGEHPAMILRDPGAAVRHFLQAALPEDGVEVPAEEQALLDDAPPSACLEFVEWGLERVASFVERCRSAAFVTPYRPEAPVQDGPIEGWILRNLGEFVYFAMPELAAEVLGRLSGVRALVQRPIYLNVLILPPGYGAPAGRYVDEDGVLVWGNYRWITRRRG